MASRNPAPFSWVDVPSVVSGQVHARAVTMPAGRGHRRPSDFAAGRLCAEQALGDAGATHASIGMAPDRAPLWPDGFVGSITHSGRLAWAAVARAAEMRSIGIDSELFMSDEVAREVVPIVLDDGEQRLIAQNSERRELETLAFSAKESLYKCLYPCVRVFFEFADAEIEWICSSATDTTSGTFGLRLRRPLGIVFPRGLRVKGRYAIDAAHVHTAVELSP
jgi:4'-phosphopantetheinyl transferase EntD